MTFSIVARPSWAVSAIPCLLLLCSALLAGCAVLGGSSASCGRGAPSLEPSRAAPGGTFRFSGGGFGGGCDDSNLPFRPESPQQDVRIEMRQGEKTWGLATADADEDYRIEAMLEVPKDVEPGGALVVTDAGDDDPFGPLEVPFEVLGGGPAAAAGGAGETAKGARYRF